MHLLGGDKEGCGRADVPTHRLFSLCICCLQHKTNFSYLHQKQWLFKTGSDSLSQLYNLSVSKAVGFSQTLWLAGGEDEQNSTTGVALEYISKPVVPVTAQNIMSTVYFTHVH